MHTGRLVLAGWLAGWLAGGLAGGLAGWLFCWLAGRCKCVRIYDLVMRDNKTILLNEQLHETAKRIVAGRGGLPPRAQR